MGIRLSTFTRLLERCHDIRPPEEDTVSDKATNLPSLNVSENKRYNTENRLTARFWVRLAHALEPEIGEIR